MFPPWGPLSDGGQPSGLPQSVGQPPSLSGADLWGWFLTAFASALTAILCVLCALDALGWRP